MQLYLCDNIAGMPNKTLVVEEHYRGGEMLRWALAFFIVALIAAIFGFAGIAVAAAGVAKILFFIFLILFLGSLLGHLHRRT